MAIQRIGVIGTGTMGAGIMQVSAQAGYDVVGCDTSEEQTAAGVKTIERMLKIATRKQGLPQEEADAARGRITTTTDQASLADCDLIIEAIVEDLGIKRKVFGTLDGICKPETIFASNTSSLSIGEIFAEVGRKPRTLGLHFFNPVPMMELVEVVRHESTDPAVIEDANAFVAAMKKTAIDAPDQPGFIVNFTLMPLLLHAARMVEEGHGTKEDIDAGMKLGAGHPAGPLELLDRIGLDVAQKVAEVISTAYPDRPHYAAPKILHDLVAAGKLGRKTGEGFYEYRKG